MLSIKGLIPSIRASCHDDFILAIVPEKDSFGDSEDGGAGAAGKKSVARRLVGTGARDIVIHIGNLIENMQISSPSIGESADQLTERVKMALLTAVNDASILADR